jgi:hypothetical protein
VELVISYQDFLDFGEEYGARGVPGHEPSRYVTLELCYVLNLEYPRMPPAPPEIILAYYLKHLAIKTPC